MSGNFTYINKVLRSRWTLMVGVICIVIILVVTSRPPRKNSVDYKHISIEQLHSLSSSQPSPEIYGELFQRAINTGNFQDALDIARKLVRLYPRDARAHNALGVAYASLNDLASARKAFQNAIELDSKRVDPYVNLGKLALTFGDYQRAVSEFDRATTVNPNSASAWIGLAEANVQLHNMQDAIDDFQRAIKIAPTRSEPYAKLGNFLAEQSRDEEARPHLKRALELGDKSEKMYAGLAMVYADHPIDQKELTQALIYAAEARKLDPTDGMVEFARGLALQRLGRYDEAIVSYRENIRDSANASGAWVGISQCYRIQGKIQLADKAAKTGELVLNHRQRLGNLKHQVESTPNKLDIREQYAEMLMSDSQYNMAAEQYRYVAMHSPEHPAKWLKAAKAFDLAGNKELADYVRQFAYAKPIAAAQKTLQKSPNHPEKAQ